jgi:hypothetical protein
MADLTVQTVSETELDVGGNFENADSALGDKAQNPNGDLYLLFKNGGASSATATLAAQNTPKSFEGHGPMTKVDKAVALAAGEEKLVGPLNAQMWNDGNGDVNIAYSGAGAADVDVLAYRGVK